MDAVRAMMTDDVQIIARDLSTELLGGIDTYVSAGNERRVILVRQHPVDLLGKERRHGCGECATGLQHSGEFTQCCHVIVDVFEHFAGNHTVE